MAVAGSIAVFVGDLVSGRRYYWAVLACFLALTGTFTTGEIAVKGINRVVGTFAGLLAATVAVHLTGKDEAAVVAVVILCVFLGLYFFRISYAVLAFAITTVMGELYNVLHEFSDSLLLLRLAETALGALAGIAVALVVLPVRTASVRAQAIDAFVQQLRAFLEEVRQRLATGERATDLFLRVRQLDGQLHQLALVALPSGGQTLVGLSGRRASRRLVPFTEAAYCARALAASVGELSLHTSENEMRGAEWTEQLASRTDALVRQLAGLRTTDGLARINAVLGGVSDEMRLLRRDVDRQLRRATGSPDDTGEFLARSLRAAGGPLSSDP